VAEDGAYRLQVDSARQQQGRGPMSEIMEAASGKLGLRAGGSAALR
jgi:hypothetical protein